MTEPQTVNGTAPVRIYPHAFQPHTTEQSTQEPADVERAQGDSAHETVTTTPPTPARRRSHKPWPLIIIGLAAAVAVWSGWVGLGQMAGFGVIHPLPGILDNLTINTAVVLPLSVEAYAAYALRVWLSTSNNRTSRTLRFAKYSALTSLGIGALAQVAYHLMEAAGYHRAPWPIVMLVAIIPVIVLGLASALAKLVTDDEHHAENQS